MEAGSSDTSGVEGIVAAIRELQLAGDKIPSERDLADRLNVKRHQLRKALQALRDAGDLRPARPKRPAKQFPEYGEELVQLTNPIEVLELRLVMEPGFARLASLRASALDIARITNAASTPTNAEPGEIDLSFHMSIAQAARNHLALEFYRMLRRVGVDARMKIANTASPSCPKRIAQRDSEHRRIAEAIAQRDPEAAEAAMRAHLHSVHKQVTDLTNAGAFAA
jgi:GntR family transcriptional repressor for pyruvate dehydrogenase complex